MSQKFTGQLEIQDSAVEPKVRITLSGDAGTARFDGERNDSPSTTVTNSRIAIGKTPSKLATPSPVAVKLGVPLHPGEGTSIPPVGPVVDTTLEPKASLSIGDESLPGGLFIIDANGRQVFKLNGVTASLTVGRESNSGDVSILDEKGELRIRLNGNAGDVSILDEKGELRIRLNGNTGDIDLMGADCAEEFDVEGDVAAIEPGTVMRIGEGGRLRPSGSAYDKRVAGIVSGAGPYRPGILLDKVRGLCERVPLALTGKAYCKVDATYAPVEMGDLLTTSATLGFAMKALDPLNAFGTVIGKALQPLPSGQGLIPILVALQ